MDDLVIETVGHMTIHMFRGLRGCHAADIIHLDLKLQAGVRLAILQ